LIFIYVDADVLAIFKTKLIWVNDSTRTRDSVSLSSYTSICPLQI